MDKREDSDKIKRLRLLMHVKTIIRLLLTVVITLMYNFIFAEPFNETTGILNISGKTASGSKIEIKACKIKYPKDSFFNKVYFNNIEKKGFKYPKYYLFSLEVKEDGKNIRIPHSASDGMFDPDFITLVPGNNNEFKVSIKFNSASASEGYTVNFFFKNNRLFKKTTVSDFCPDKPSVETIYSICEVG